MYGGIMPKKCPYPDLKCAVPGCSKRAIMYDTRVAHSTAACCDSHLQLAYDKHYRHERAHNMRVHVVKLDHEEIEHHYIPQQEHAVVAAE